MPAALIPNICDDDVESSQILTYDMDTEPCQGADYVGRSMLERESIRRDREREGRCADCGVQTHSFMRDEATGMQVKVPLTVKREVHRGRCLLCYPIFPPEFLSRVHRAPENPINPHLQQQQQHCQTTPFSETIAPNQVVITPQSPPTGLPKASRRVSQSNLLGYHNPSDPAVKEALSMLQSMAFDIVDIISAMKRASHDRVVQERGCERLWVLSWEDENSAAIGRVGGIPVVLDAMGRFPLNAHLQQCACECLQNLAHVNDFNRREIAEYQGINMIVQAMIRHMDCAGIQQCGCTALASISATKELIRIIMASGGFHAVLIAARRFANDQSVLRAAYDGLQAMGYDPVGRLPPLGLAYIH
uniref:Uncharacterized protein n=1 Tax=Amphora coffeiformis TaxID=265554 RepID=A0A7S3L0N7_9STRA|mmetsp:Transcript_9897/g.18992  ORF Transcript_9897/g.18992 Transcript_9897/m.18992 type:complete len:361 (+) Transcript_9897:139-1221(+)|eukprot:scaffold1068_cov167-Amphora_coffeaeformis.AAC.13